MPQDESKRKRAFVIALVLLALFNLFLYARVFVRHELTVSMLVAGEGTAVLVEGPTGKTALIDAGSDRSILRELGAALPFWQRHIDMLAETRPDVKVIGGIPDVLERYDVSNFLASEVPDTTRMNTPIQNAVQVEPHLKVISAARGTKIDLGGAYAQVLFPDRDASKLNAETGSLVLLISYGKTSFVYFGGASAGVEDWVTSLDAKLLQNAVMLQDGEAATYRSDGVTARKQ